MIFHAVANFIENKSVFRTYNRMSQPHRQWTTIQKRNIIIKEWKNGGNKNKRMESLP